MGKMTRAEELANNAFLTKTPKSLRPEFRTLHELVVKAIETGMREVRKRDAEICVSGMHDDAGNAHNLACHDCAAAIDREKMP